MHLCAPSPSPLLFFATRYAGQQEIWEYQRRVAKKYNLYEKIRFRTEVTHTEWHEDLQQWVLDWINHNTGETGQTNADIVFSGTGPLRVPQIPKQFEAFEGPKWHTAQWNHDYDLTGKRIAVVGSGARYIFFYSFLIAIGLRKKEMTETRVFNCSRFGHHALAFN